MAAGGSLAKDTYQAILDRASHYGVYTYSTEVPYYLTAYKLKQIAGYYNKKDWSLPIGAYGYALDHTTSYDNMDMTVDDGYLQAQHIPTYFGGRVANGNIKPSDFTEVLDSSKLTGLYNDLLRLGRFAIDDSITYTKAWCWGNINKISSPSGHEESTEYNVNFNNVCANDFVEVGEAVYNPLARYSISGGGQNETAVGSYEKIETTNSIFRILLDCSVASCIALVRFYCVWYTESGGESHTYHCRLIRMTNATGRYWQCAITKAMLEGTKSICCPSINPQKSDTRYSRFSITAVIPSTFIITF